MADIVAEVACRFARTVIPSLEGELRRGATMMGRHNQDQGQLFYSFDLEAAVPGDHPAPEIAAVLDLSWVYDELAPHYPSIGRPSIDPVLMMRMLRSEHRGQAAGSLAFSRARNERFNDSGIFRKVFDRVVAACIAADLVGGEGFAVDASLIAADANKHRSIPGREWNKDIDPAQASRAVKEYPATMPPGSARASNRAVMLTPSP
jgi:transposase